jgi:hypothetical protein
LFETAFLFTDVSVGEMPADRKNSLYGSKPDGARYFIIPLKRLF